MQYLVTGSNGFIGSNVVRSILDNNYGVKGLIRNSSNLINLEGLDLETVTGDIRNKKEIQKAAKDVDGVFHTAALYSFWASSYQKFYEINVQGTKNVLEAAEEAGVERVVITSTASLLAHSEDKTRLPDSSTALPSDYKISKYIAEKEALKFANNSGMDVIISSPTVPVGPGDYKPTPTGKLILEFLNGNMPGIIDMNFNLVDVEDVAEGHLLAMEKGKSGKRYVLGNKNTSLSEVISRLSCLTGLPKPRFRIPYPVALAAAWLDEFVEGFLINRRPTIPISAIESTRVDERIDPTPWLEELGMPRTSVPETLEKAVNWFRDNDYLKNREVLP